MLRGGHDLYELFEYSKCKFEFPILHPNDVKEAQDVKGGLSPSSYYWNQGTVPDRTKSNVEKELDAGSKEGNG